MNFSDISYDYVNAIENAARWNDRFLAEREELKAAKLRHPSEYKEYNGQDNH